MRVHAQGPDHADARRFPRKDVHALVRMSLRVGARVPAPGFGNPALAPRAGVRFLRRDDCLQRALVRRGVRTRPRIPRAAHPVPEHPDIHRRLPDRPRALRIEPIGQCRLFRRKYDIRNTTTVQIVVDQVCGRCGRQRQTRRAERAESVEQSRRLCFRVGKQRTHKKRKARAVRATHSRACADIFPTAATEIGW